MTQVDTAPQANLMTAVSFSGLGNDDDDQTFLDEMNNIRSDNMKRNSSTFSPPPPLSSFQPRPMADRSPNRNTLRLHSITASPSTEPPPLTAADRAREFLSGLSLELGNSSDNTTTPSWEESPTDEQHRQQQNTGGYSFSVEEGDVLPKNNSNQISTTITTPQGENNAGGEPAVREEDEEEEQQHEARSTRLLLDRVELLKTTTTKQAATAAFGRKEEQLSARSVIIQGNTVGDRYKWCCDNVRLWCKASTLGFPAAASTTFSSSSDDVDEVEALWRADALDTSQWGQEKREEGGGKRAPIKSKRKGVPAHLPQLSHVLRIIAKSPDVGGSDKQHLFNHPFFLADEEGTLSLSTVSIAPTGGGNDNDTTSPLQNLPPVCNRRGIIPLLLALLVPQSLPFSSVPASSSSSIVSNIVRLDLSNCDMDDLVIRFLTHGALLTGKDVNTPRTRDYVATRGLLSGLVNLVELDLSNNPLISSRGGQWLYAYISGGIVSTRANKKEKSVVISSDEEEGANTIVLLKKDGMVVGEVPMMPRVIPTTSSSSLSRPSKKATTSIYSPEYDTHTATNHAPNPHLVCVVLDGCTGIQSRSIRAIRTILREKSKSLIE